MDLSVLIVTSPSLCHPSTILIDSVIDSLSLIPHLSLYETPIHIIMDGYHVIQPHTIPDSEEDNLDTLSTTENDIDTLNGDTLTSTPPSKVRLKKGVIDRSIEENYSEYRKRIFEKYGHQPRFHIHRLQSHHGFALAVKYGLTCCNTQYALILQHDRVFATLIDFLPHILQTMETHTHIRYVGFPSSMSSNHVNVMTTKGLKSLHRASILVEGQEERLKLQPLIFWYDSQHIAHVKRYLEIYQPYSTLPQDLVAYLTKPTINAMRIRRGDFIEDRFGQIQRQALIALRYNDDLLWKLFHWYGSYLVWDANLDYRCNGTEEYIVHLRGRKQAERHITATMEKVLKVTEVAETGYEK